VALDLGIAYMGMDLYEEALEEFRKALDTPPPTGTEASRLAAMCLIHQGQFSAAQELLDELLVKSALGPAEKADIIGDAVGFFLDQGALGRARDLLAQTTEEERRFIDDFDVIFQAISTKHSEYVAPAEAKVTKSKAASSTGKTAPRPPAANDRELSGMPEKPIPLRGRVSYSLDNRNWKEGLCTRLSQSGAELRLSETIQPGVPLILRLHLPNQGNDEPILVVSRVSSEESEPHAEDEGAVQVTFQSFLPKGEAALKTFLQQRSQDDFLQEGSLDEVTEETLTGEDKLFAQLEKEALNAMQDALLPANSHTEPALVQDRQLTPKEEPSRPSRAGQKGKAARGAVERPAAIRFACQCGQVHVVAGQRVGSKGKCSHCGRETTVPLVDPRPDALAEQFIGKTVGGCCLLYKIGGGGMGGVFKGHHLGLDTPVAVKILHSHLATRDTVFVKRFIREARAAARLQHPNIVGVMNVGVEESSYFIIMPFLGGGSAAALLNKVKKIPVEKVLEIAIDMARALGVAEENRMLHRDIKPANILFNEKGEAKLADLGLAKSYFDAQDPSITQTGIACGTPLYFSPEQAKGLKNLDIRSDIYSLGITLYHLLNGSPPFTGESAYVIFQKHVHEKLPPFDGSDPPIPNVIFQMLQKMTSKDREQRYKNSEELLAALLEVKKQTETPPKQAPRRKGILEILGIRRPR